MIHQIISDTVNLNDCHGLAIAGFGLAEMFFDGAYRWHIFGVNCRLVSGKSIGDFCCCHNFVVCLLFWFVVALRRATEKTLPNTCEIATSFFIYFHFPLFYQG
jgi:hypothetical protein